MTRRSLAALAAVLLLFGSAPSPAAAADPPKRPGLWGEIRDRLGRSDAAELVVRARGMASASEALLLYQSAAERDRSPAAQQACLWLGHFHHGAGDLEVALGWFERGAAMEGEPGRQAEAAFWQAHCAGLLGRANDAAAPRSARGTVHDILYRIATADGALRRGEGSEAIAAYLSLADEAERAGCAGPLLYRMGLAAAVGRGGETLSEQLRALAAAAPASPERALATLLVPAVAPPRAAAPPAEPAGGGAPVSFAEGMGPSPGAGEGDAAGDAAGEAAAGGDLGVGKAAGGAFYAVQLGAFRDPGRAGRELDRLRALGLDVRMEDETVAGERLHLLRLGRMDSEEAAEEFARTRCTGLEWRVVRLAAGGDGARP